MVVEGTLQGLMLLEDLGFCEQERGRVMEQIVVEEDHHLAAKGSMRAEE